MKIPAAPPNLIDRVIAAVSPERGLARQRARTLLAMGGGGYVGGDRTRRAQRLWDHRPTSADQATLRDLVDLRSSSRDLVRNNPLACGAINTVTTSVVGTGLAVQPQILSSALRMDPAAARAWQQSAKEIFELWAMNPAWCDLTASMSFYELQELAFRSALESGDAFALLPMQKYAGEPISTKVQIIEADRVCNPEGKGDSDTLAAGIETDASGRPVICHIAERHPGGYIVGGNRWESYRFFGEKTGRRNVLHLISRLRPGQRRGVPYLAPVIEAIKQLGIYTEAEITAAVTSGMLAFFVKKEGIDRPIGEPGQAVGPGAVAANEVELQPGAMVDLSPGEDIVMANPARPNEKFDPFFIAITRQIGVALELPNDILLKMFNASYSASRAAFLEAWRFYKKRRAWLAGQFCQPIYEAVIWEAVASGKLIAPGFLRDPMIRAAYCRAEWVGDAPGSLNPLDEASAAEKRIQIGISSRAKESIAHDGSNWEDNHNQQVLEHQARERDGLTPPPPAAVAPPPPDAGQSAAQDALARALQTVVDAQQQLSTAEARREVHFHSHVAPSPVTIAEGAVQVKAGDTVVTVPEREVHLEATVEAPTVHNHVRAYPAQSTEQVERDEHHEITRIVRTNKD